MKYTTLCMVVYCMLAAKIFCMENQEEYSLSLQASNQLKHFYNNDFTPQQLYKESDIQDLEIFSRIIQNRTQESHDANNKIKKTSLLKELSDIIIEQKKYNF